MRVATAGQRRDMMRLTHAMQDPKSVGQPDCLTVQRVRSRDSVADKEGPHAGRRAGVAMLQSGLARVEVEWCEVRPGIAWWAGPRASEAWVGAQDAC